MTQFNSFVLFYPLSFLSSFLKTQKVGTCSLDSPFFRVFLVISFVDTTKYGTFHTYPNDQSLGLIMDNFQIQNTTQNGVLKP